MITTRAKNLSKETGDLIGSALEFIEQFCLLRNCSRQHNPHCKTTKTQNTQIIHLTTVPPTLQFMQQYAQLKVNYSFVFFSKEYHYYVYI